MRKIILVLVVLCSCKQSNKEVNDLFDKANEKFYDGKYESAIKDLNKVIEINPDRVLAYNIRGFCKHGLDNNRGAIEDFTKAIEIDSNYLMAYVGRGLVKIRIKNYRNAIKDFNMAIEIDPDYALTYRGRGVGKLKLGNKNEACLDWYKAKDLGSITAIKLIKEHCE